MAPDPKEGLPDRKPVDQHEAEVEKNDGVDETVEVAGGGDGVLFDELGEVVEAGGEGEGQEDEAEGEAQVAESGEDVHL